MEFDAIACAAAAFTDGCRRFFQPSYMATTLIALGANLGDRRAHLQRALRLLDRPPELRVVARSRWFHTAPIGGPADQSEFVNAAAVVETSLSPQQLLAVLRKTEAELGRQRRQRWAARCVDLDLLLFDDLILKTPELELPHPRMAFRRFVLEPAADVASELRHPVIGWTIGQLLQHLNTALNYVAVTGVPGVGKTRLAQDVAAATASRFVADPVVDAERQGPSAESGPAERVLAERNRWQRRWELLAQHDKPGGGSAVLSDFWLGQSLAYSRLWPDERQRDDFAAQCRLDTFRVGNSVAEDGAPVWPAHPKLLVLLDLQHVPPRWEPVRTELRRLVFQPGHGPMLELDATRPDWAFVELGAALDAMR